MADVLPPCGQQCHSSGIDYTALMDSAESVLRGGKARGPLACVPNLAQRRWLASSLLQRNAIEVMPIGWLRSLAQWAKAPDCCISRLARIDDVRCRCGKPEHEHAAAGMTTGNVFWHAYHDAMTLSSETQRRRKQAAQAFPVAMHLVLRSAHSIDEPAPRVHAAWGVIDTVDRGGKLIPALARYLKLGRTAIKVSHRLQDESDHLRARPFGVARRSLRMLPALLANGFSTIEVNALWDWLPVLDLIARAARVEPRVILCVMPHHLAQAEQARPLGTFAIHAVLRAAIRKFRTRPAWALCKLRRGEFTALFDLHCKQVMAPRVDIDLACGWNARSLVSGDEVVWEGEVMRHCAGRFASDLMVGDVQIFSLRSGDGREKATLVVSPPFSETNGNIRIEMAGCANSPMHSTAILAMHELIRSLGRTGLRVVIAAA